MHGAKKGMHIVTVTCSICNRTVEVRFGKLHWFKLNEVGYLFWLQERNLLFQRFSVSSLFDNT